MRPARSSLRARSFPLIHPLLGSDESFTSPQMGEMIDRGSREGSCRAYISEEAQTFFSWGVRIDAADDDDDAAAEGGNLSLFSLSLFFFSSSSRERISCF